MTLTPGSLLGPYEVTALLGEGGMGQVYRATDTNLKRQVALKVLPASLAGDADRLARFQREAEVLAALNHPSIAAIYGLQKSEGVTALVMELVEGQDLSERIAKGPIPLDEALPIARQIAEALEAAHEQGIVHRDLKPANLKVRADGTVKILDFGLAKAIGSTVTSPPELTQSPTMTSPATTHAGMILGTAAYMSPEQARGRPVDKRADIWAFGCVVFEMLAARRAFDGEDLAETLGATIHREPDWARLPPTVPAWLKGVLQRSLQKDPKQRTRDIGDVRLALNESMSESAAPIARRSDTGTPVRWRTWLTAALATAVGIAVTVLATSRYLRPTPAPSAPEMRLDIATAATGDPISFAMSPDGRQMVFVADDAGTSRLWLRSLATTSAQPLAGTNGAASPFWSPDSRSIGFFADGSLKRLDLGSSAPQVLARSGSGFRGGTWNAEGVILFTPSSASPVFQVSATGGQAAPVTKLDGQSSHRWPSFLPDGRHFLYLAQGPTPEASGIYLAELGATEVHRLTPSDTKGVYLRPDLLLWVRTGTLVAQRLDLAHATLTGNPSILADPVVVDTTSGSSAVSASMDGLVAYRAGAGARRQLAWFDRSGDPKGRVGEIDEASLVNPSMSPDGHTVAVTRTVQGNSDVWILDGNRSSRLTFDAGLDRYTVWSPDGQRLIFQSNRQGPRNLYQRAAAAGEGAEERLGSSDEAQVPNSWSRDGRSLLFYSVSPKTGRDLWVRPMVGDRFSWPFLQTRFEERNGAFSPDGRWIAYQSNESGRDEIYLRPFAERSTGGVGEAAASDSAQRQVSTAGGVFPRWRQDGKELYYLGPSGEMMAVAMTTSGSALVPATPVTLFRTAIVGGGSDNGLGWEYDVAGDRFLINTVVNETPQPITVLMNWNPQAMK